MAMMRIGTQRWPPMKIPPVLGSVAEAMAFLMVLHMMWNTHEFSYHHVDVSTVFDDKVVLVHYLLRDH